MPLSGDADVQRSIHAQVAAQIGREIVRGAVGPGQALPTEHALCHDFKVSRTVIREAIKLLSAKGLVESRPRIGTKVRARAAWNMLDTDVLAWRLAAVPPQQFAHDLFEMREIFEPAAAAIAAQRRADADLQRIHAALGAMVAEPAASAGAIDADVDFHQAILAATGNEFLVSLGALIEIALRTSFRLSELRQGAHDSSLVRHEAVATAIVDADGEAARAAMAGLLRASKADLVWVLEHLHRGQALPSVLDAGGLNVVAIG